ncbi:hypothetical protein ACFYPB_19745 [Streptomyces olivaceoviridis]|uniref:hypothetical protein n=1 Tax=Streptomyces olivaceoviridis TaxID=1921 RepID=UPI0036C8D4C0
MRTRIRLTSVVMGAAMLAGGAVGTAQAAPASSEAVTASCTAMGWPTVYICRTLRECRETAENLGYEDWVCLSRPDDWWELRVYT